MKASLSKTNVIIISVVAGLVILAIIATLLYFFVFTRIDVKISGIERVGTDVRVIEATSTEPLSLYKPDDNGNISSEPFKILAFTDTHLDTYRRRGAFTIEYLIGNVQREKPDLVVFVGDVVTSSVNRARAHQVAQVMEKLEVYWVGVLGNHEGDNRQSISRQEFIKIYSSYSHCLIDNAKKRTKEGELVWGNGNTQINILSGENQVAQSLFFLDSGDRVSKEDAQTLAISEDSYDFVKASQIKWYEERVAELDEGVKSMIFVHIPLCEYADAVDNALKNEDGTFVLNEEAEDGTMVGFGYKLDDICCSDYNSGLFEAILNGGSTQAVVSGHDHINTFRIRYKGVWLCYNRCSGYSSYNVVTRKLGTQLEQGATIYYIEESGALTFGDIINRDYFDSSKALKLYKRVK